MRHRVWLHVVRLSLRSLEGLRREFAPQGAAQQQALHQVALPPQQAPPQQHSDAAGQQAPLASAAEALSLLTGGGWG